MRSSLSVAALCVALLLALSCPRPAGAFGAVPVDRAREAAVLRLIDCSVSVFTTQKPVSIVLVVKDLQRVMVIEHDGVQPRILVQYVCSTGANSGNKRLRGDERTPEGVYFITKVYTDSKVTVFGRRAFHLDYPNYFDQAASRGGDGIFIHGTNRELRPNNSNGCVTLDNHDLDDMARYLARDEVPVIIVPNLKVSGPDVSLADSPIGPVKALVLPNGVERERMDFDSLYLIRVCGQAVAVAEFSETARRRGGGGRGYSRSYLEFRPESGWISAQWVWHPTATPVKTAEVAAPARRRVIVY